MEQRGLCRGQRAPAAQLIQAAPPTPSHSPASFAGGQANAKGHCDQYGKQGSLCCLMAVSPAGAEAEAVQLLG